MTLPKIKLNKSISFSKKKSTYRINIEKSNIEKINELQFEIEKKNIEVSDLTRRLENQTKINSRLNCEIIDLNDQGSTQLENLKKKYDEICLNKQGLQNAYESEKKQVEKIK